MGFKGRPDWSRLDRLRRRGELLDEFHSTEPRHRPKTRTEVLVSGAVLLTALLIAVAAIIRII